MNSFYARVQRDVLLSPIFQSKIADRWPGHLEKMYRFWETLLLEDRTYFGRPFPPHAQLPVNKTHFNRWMELFIETVDSLFTGAKADEAKWRAEKMAELFSAKIEYIQKTGHQPLI